MNARSIRRAAERKARKLAQLRPLLDQSQASDQPLEIAPEQAQPASSADAAIHISPAQLAANRGNARLSTGPTSETGKAKASLNALKTGLTGRTILLPGDDVEAYHAHVTRFEEHWNPATEPERELVQSIAATEWRLLRIPSLESGIYALGRLHLAAPFESQPESVRATLIDAQTFVTYQRQLNNLGIQENRLRRQRDKDIEQLRNMQSEREQEERQHAKEREKALTEAVFALEAARKEGKPFDPSAFGFEFSIEELDDCLDSVLQARERRRQIREQADAQHDAFRRQAIAKVRRQSEAA